MPPHQYFYRDTSLEGLPAKAKEDPSPHEMRLSPAGHQPSIYWSLRSLIINLSEIIMIIMIMIIIFIITIIIIIILSSSSSSP